MEPMTWYVRDLSEAERERIRAHLQSFVRLVCTACNGASLTVGGIVGIPVLVMVPGEVLEDPLVPMVACSCSDCGLMRFFAAKPILGDSIFETPRRLRLVVEDEDEEGP